MNDWKDHCAIDDEHPVQRQAWHAGWMHRMENGPGLHASDTRETVQRSMDEYGPAILSAWMQGYSAADNIERGQ